MAYPILLEHEYLKLTEGAELVKRTRTKIRLLLSSEKKIIKHIYKRKLLSTSTIWPYASRFIKNAKHLSSKNISVPKINAVYFYPTLNCDILIYDFVSGMTLYDLARTNNISFMPDLARYLVGLHDLGIYFKDIHLNNLVSNNDTFTLLDLESIQYQHRPLTITQRIRNLTHLFNKKEDVQFYQQFGLDRFLEEYFHLACLSERLCRKIKRVLGLRVPQDLLQS